VILVFAIREPVLHQANYSRERLFLCRHIEMNITGMLPPTGNLKANFEGQSQSLPASEERSISQSCYKHACLDLQTRVSGGKIWPQEKDWQFI
jgi:hypothetical protein